jgi:hypothetical protein
VQPAWTAGGAGVEGVVLTAGQALLGDLEGLSHKALPFCAGILGQMVLKTRRKSAAKGEHPARRERRRRQRRVVVAATPSWARDDEVQAKIDGGSANSTRRAKGGQNEHQRASSRHEVTHRHGVLAPLTPVGLL